MRAQALLMNENLKTKTLHVLNYIFPTSKSAHFLKRNTSANTYDQERLYQEKVFFSFLFLEDLMYNFYKDYCV